MNEEYNIKSSDLESGDQDENIFIANLRPATFSEYIGQKRVRENLHVCIEAAKKRKDSVEHLILYGPPGLGKTTLANIIANEMGSNIRVTSGPAIERAGDLASILTNLKDGDVLFIDEIHRLNRNIEEILYPAMEDFVIDLILGKGPSAKTMRLDLPKFSLVGATTKIGSLSSPLRDRFGLTLRLEFYQDEELEEILKRTAKVLGVNVEKKALSEIAKRSRRTPRVANRLLKRVRDYALVKGKGDITERITHEAIQSLDIDNLGLDRGDREYLTAIIDKFSGGPVGLDTISAAISEDKTTIEDVIEPYLLKLGFIERTPKGRKTTHAAHNHLGKSHIVNSQKRLI